MKIRAIDWRRASQAVILALFAAYIARPDLLPGVDLLFRGDIVTVTTGALAARWLRATVIFIVGIVVLTLMAGRGFCGWICPLGAVIDGVDTVTGRRTSFRGSRVAKYHVLALLGGLAFSGVALAWIVDPLNWAARIVGLTGWGRAEFGLGIALLAVLIAVELVLGRRGFCRAMCPFGAAVGVLTRRSAMRLHVTDACIDCGVCVRGCRMAAFGEKPTDFDATECVLCRECDSACPTDALRFEFLAPLSRPTEPARRAFLFSAVGGLALGVVGRKTLAKPSSAPPLRPPGALPEDRFRNVCIRCGTCIRICPTGGLRPIDDGSPLWWKTPVLDGRAGGCAYDCAACGEACPTWAIRPLPLEQKRVRQIGLAKIDPARCLPLSGKNPCVMCYVACPAGAIAVQKTDVVYAVTGAQLLGPLVIAERCIGCGLCENACPAPGAGAIKTVGLSPQSSITVSPAPPIW